MTKYYLLQENANPEKFVIVGASGFTPENVVVELTPEFAQEEAEWLIVSDSTDEFGNPTKVVTIDTVLKAEILNERALAKEASDRLAMRSRKRAFGETIIDLIAVTNEEKSLSGAALDGFMTDPFFSLMREHLKAGNIKSFWEKLGAADVSAFYTAEEKAMILSKCEEFLIQIGEVTP